MTTTTPISTRFIEPLDLLFLRGNQSFGEPGSYGEALMPPWPSVAAGALRSRMLADDGVDLAAFAAGQAPHPCLGTPADPGSFTLQAFQVARRHGQAVELLAPLPADLVVHQDEGAQPSVAALRPVALHPALATSSPLPQLAVLAQGQTRRKPATGWWLRQSGWAKYLRGQALSAADLVHAKELWSFDERVGVGLDAATRSAADGRLFSNRAVAMHVGVGFAVAVAGAELPAGGSLRFGGDGRAVALHPATIDWPEPDYEAISRAGRCRLVLTSPAILAGGWQLAGMEGGVGHGEPDGGASKPATATRLSLPGLRAQVVAAALPRQETISGWNLATRAPKPAQQAVPAGSVYWLDALQASAADLRKLVAHGLWGQVCEDAQRRTEGFNRFSFAPF